MRILISTFTLQNSGSARLVILQKTYPGTLKTSLSADPGTGARPSWNGTWLRMKTNYPTLIVGVVTVVSVQLQLLAIR